MITYKQQFIISVADISNKNGAASTNDSNDRIHLKSEYIQNSADSATDISTVTATAVRFK